MNFPPSYEAYDLAAQAAQRDHFLTLRIQLSLVVGGSGIAAIVALAPAVIPSVPGFSAIVVLFALGILLQLAMGRLKLDSRWYSFRAVREAQKSLAWQYAMRLGEFSGDGPAARAQFLEGVGESEKEFDIKPILITPKPEDEAHFLTELEGIRTADWKARRDRFIQDRIDDQIRWYGRKAEANRRAALKLEASVVGLQVVGIVAGVALLDLHLNGSALLSLVLGSIGALVGWGQARQHSALVGPYANAQRELLNIHQLVSSAESEGEFTRAAGQAEEAISREHSLWCARRGLQPFQARRQVR